MKKKKKRERHLVAKFFLSIVYLVIITILFVGSYQMFQEKTKVVPWKDVESTEDYTYIDISKMSEKFAYFEESNLGIHFVIEEEDTGLWHTYLIAINENEYDKYKAMIDYTYERTDKKPDVIRVYGYPRLVEEDLKIMAVKNIKNFLPAENEVEITTENYEKYLTNSYLDTTIEKEESFNIILFASLLAMSVVVLLFLLTILDRGKPIPEEREEEIIPKKQAFGRRKPKKESGEEDA